MKKLLIISYYWPPCGGIGVLRSLKLAKYIRSHGWEPIVFVPDGAHYPVYDQSNNKDIPEGITVIKGRIWEPFKIYKLITGKKKDANIHNALSSHSEKMGLMHNLSVWVRSNFFIPDARSKWIKPSVKFLTRYLSENPVDAIFTSGPPHTNTRIATLVKKATGTPWLSDFQDPWTQVDYFNKLNLTKNGLAKHKRQEQEAFAAADAMTVVSENWKSDLEGIGARNLNVVYWGYDPDDYQDLTYNIDQKFTLSHIGLMSSDRNPKLLFKVIKSLNEELVGFANDLKLRLAGEVDFNIREAYIEEGIEANVEELGMISRQDALQMTLNSNVLLLLLNQQVNAKGRVPGKFFEYLAARRPIISLGSSDGDVAMILEKTNHGKSFEYDTFESLRSHLKLMYQHYSEGRLRTNIESDISEYSHPVLTEKIAGVLESISK